MISEICKMFVSINVVCVFILMSVPEVATLFATDRDYSYSCIVVIGWSDSTGRYARVTAAS
jgi:hypothetical protein